MPKVCGNVWSCYVYDFGFLAMYFHWRILSDGWMAERGMVQSAGNHFRLGVTVRIHIGAYQLQIQLQLCSLSLELLVYNGLLSRDRAFLAIATRLCRFRTPWESGSDSLSTCTTTNSVGAFKVITAYQSNALSNREQPPPASFASKSQVIPTNRLAEVALIPCSDLRPCANFGSGIGGQCGRLYVGRLMRMRLDAAYNFPFY